MRRMWSTSRWERLARTSRRRASSSRPKASASSGVSCLLVMRVLSEGELEVGARDRDAEANLLIGLAGDGACGQVLDGAALLATPAGVADAHPAAGGGALTRSLELDEQGRGTREREAAAAQLH